MKFSSGTVSALKEKLRLRATGAPGEGLSQSWPKRGQLAPLFTPTLLTMVTVQATRIQGALQARKRSAAGVGDGYADLSGRSVNAVIGATSRHSAGVGEAPAVTEIPVLPISYRDAFALLQAMGGEVVPRGSLVVANHLSPRARPGSSPEAGIQLGYGACLQRDRRLAGSEYPDEWVIRGNHHDGWNHGAADPISGLVALMGEAKALAELAAEGKGPKRSVVYAAWDSEEQGLIGSTEWVEHHAAQLDDHAVAYINTDGNSRGFVNIGGSHVLEKMANEVMRDVEDPQTEYRLPTGVVLALRSMAVHRRVMNFSGAATCASACWVPVLIIRRFFSIWALRR